VLVVEHPATGERAGKPDVEGGKILTENRIRQSNPPSGRGAFLMHSSNYQALVGEELRAISKVETSVATAG
jgi:hypothetical protein